MGNARTSVIFGKFLSIFDIFVHGFDVKLTFFVKNVPKSDGLVRKLGVFGQFVSKSTKSHPIPYLSMVIISVLFISF